MDWACRQNGRQQVNKKVDKMETSYAQLNAWQTEDEMGRTSPKQKILALVEKSICPTRLKKKRNCPEILI